MFNNAEYFSHENLETIATYLESGFSPKSCKKMGRWLRDIAGRYPGHSFKVKVILAGQEFKPVKGKTYLVSKYVPAEAAVWLCTEDWKGNKKMVSEAGVTKTLEEFERWMKLGFTVEEQLSYDD